jgi:hypothetical protein
MAGSMFSPAAKTAVLTHDTIHSLEPVVRKNPIRASTLLIENQP